jgi:hypothetical protein
MLFSFTSEAFICVESVYGKRFTCAMYLFNLSMREERLSEVRCCG